MSKYLKKIYQQGIIHITSTKNNTLITLTDMHGNVQYFASTGTLGFKNSRKSTPYAAQAVAEQVAAKATHLGFTSVILKLRGLGYGKESSLRSFLKSNLTLVQIVEATPVAHNGCRPLKKRRI